MSKSLGTLSSHFHSHVTAKASPVVKPNIKGPGSTKGRSKSVDLGRVEALGPIIQSTTVI